MVIKLIMVVFLTVQCPHDQTKKESSKNIEYFLRYGRFSKCSFWSKASPFFLSPQQFSLYDIYSWAWDVNKYQILVPLIPLKVPKSILEVFKTLPEICSQHLILQSGPTVQQSQKQLLASPVLIENGEEYVRKVRKSC